jgi:vancomycin resistance protein VanJ
MSISPSTVIERNVFTSDSATTAHPAPVPRRTWWAMAHTAVALASWSLLIASLTQFVLIRYLGDRWWLGTVALFAPRWPLLVPIAAVAALSAIFCRQGLAVNLVSALIVAGPVMGLCLSIPHSPPQANASQFRVMTINAGNATDAGIRAQIALHNPQIVAIQEATRRVPEDLFGPGWNVQSVHGFLTASVYPILKFDVFPGNKVGRWGYVAFRVQLDTPSGKLWVYNLHLETPRWGFEELQLTRRGLSGTDAVTANTHKRSVESAFIRDWVDETSGPTVILGDFNTPTESAIFQRDWSNFSDAYSTAGVGYGNTKFTRWHGVRIDHILTDVKLFASECMATESTDGDHRPLLATLNFRGFSD